MFILAHLGALGIFPKGARKQMACAAIGAMFPDLTFTVPAAVYSFSKFISGNLNLVDAFSSGVKTAHEGMVVADSLEHICHSLLVFSAVLGILAFLYCRVSRLQKIPIDTMFFMSGWLSHIILDFLSHKPPHNYFWPFNWALPWPYIYNHELLNITQELCIGFGIFIILRIVRAQIVRWHCHAKLIPQT